MGGAMDGRTVPPADGTLALADAAVAALVREAVLSCYGVLGVGRRSAVAGLARRLHLARLARRGRWLAVRVADGRVTVDLAVQVAAGTPIAAIARNVAQVVRYRLEPVLGMPVDRVNVRVDGLGAGPSGA